MGERSSVMNRPAAATPNWTNPGGNPTEMNNVGEEMGELEPSPTQNFSYYHRRISLILYIQESQSHRSNSDLFATFFRCIFAPEKEYFSMHSAWL